MIQRQLYDLQAEREHQTGSQQPATLSERERQLISAGLRPLGFRDPGARLAQVRRFAPALLAGNLAVLARK